MKVLVAYDSGSDSRRGFTVQIAEWIGAELRQARLAVEVRRAREVDSVGGYHGVVLGSELHQGAWRPGARRFVRRHAAALAGTPVWLYSSGPLDQVVHRAIPKPVPDAAEALTRLHARAHATFGGAVHWDSAGLFDSPAALRAYGQYRDRERVRSWAARIATALTPPPSRMAA